MALGKDDLDLIDALVANGCISRPAAREVAATAQPGRVASFIMERGLCNLAAHSGYVIVERLAKYEALAETGFGKVTRSVRDEVFIPETD